MKKQLVIWVWSYLTYTVLYFYGWLKWDSLAGGMFFAMVPFWLFAVSVRVILPAVIADEAIERRLRLILAGGAIVIGSYLALLHYEPLFGKVGTPGLAIAIICFIGGWSALSQCNVGRSWLAYWLVLILLTYFLSPPVQVQAALLDHGINFSAAAIGSEVWRFTYITTLLLILSFMIIPGVLEDGMQRMNSISARYLIWISAIASAVYAIQLREAVNPLHLTTWYAAVISLVPFFITLVVGYVGLTMVDYEFKKSNFMIGGCIVAATLLLYHLTFIVGFWVSLLFSLSLILACVSPVELIALRYHTEPDIHQAPPHRHSGTAISTMIGCVVIVLLLLYSGAPWPYKLISCLAAIISFAAANGIMRHERQPVSA